MEENDDYELRQGDWHILDAFYDAESKFAFQGLKRKLRMHQESLSRALRRLERDQLVEHTQEGYRLTSRGSAMLKRTHKDRVQSHKILETYLPSDVSVSDLIARLKYSWFSTLRWLGYTETRDGAVLSWLTEDGSFQIKARFQGNQLTIETDSKPEQMSPLSIKFAHELISHIAKEYQEVADSSENSRFNN